MELDAKSNLTGMKFGKLTAIQRVPNYKGKITWECVCECGNTTFARADRLTGKSKVRRVSCGCVRSTQRAFPGVPYGNIYVVLHHYISGAKRRQLEWGLSESRAIELLRGNCYYCGCSPSAVSNSQKDEAFVHNGIDRLYPEDGYLPGNTVSCCANCNYCKQTMNVDEFLALIRRIYLNTNN